MRQRILLDRSFVFPLLASCCCSCVTLRWRRPFQMVLVAHLALFGGAACWFPLSRPLSLPPPFVLFFGEKKRPCAISNPDFYRIPFGIGNVESSKNWDLFRIRYRNSARIRWKIRKKKPSLIKRLGLNCHFLERETYNAISIGNRFIHFSSREVTV